MKLKIRYENKYQTLEVNSDEMWVSLSLECDENLTQEEKETIIKQYKSYHDLGGDTFITEMVNQVKDLPVKGTSVIINRDEI